MTSEELEKSRELLTSYINDVIKPCQSIEPSNADETVFKIAMNVIAIHVPKLLDYINELENMPLIQTVKEQEKQLGEALGNVVLWQEMNRQSCAKANGYYEELVEARKEIERLRDALERIIHRSEGAEDQLKLREEPSNYNWNIPWWKGHATGLQKAEEIARQALEGESNERSVASGNHA